MDGYTLFVLTFETAAYNTWWELWRSDGTVSGTHLLKKGLTEGNDPSFMSFMRQGSLLLFAANGVEYSGDTSAGATLWQTDGTAEGTTLVRSLSGRPAGPDNIVYKQDALYFYAHDQNNLDLRCSIWQGTGTSATTFSVQRFQMGMPGKPCAGLERQVMEFPPPCIE
jgi:ELWxxDGT repeat protein